MYCLVPLPQINGIVSGSDDSVVIVWTVSVDEQFHAKELKAKRRLDPTPFSTRLGGILSVSVTEDGAHLAVCYTRGVVLWALAKKELMWLYEVLSWLRRTS